MNTVESPALNAATAAPDIAARYLSAWNATDATEREHLVRETFSQLVDVAFISCEG